MKFDDIMGAVKDIFGKPITIDGKVYDHLHEVEDGIAGLRTQATKLERMIRSGKLTDEQVAAAQELIDLSNAHANRVQDTLDIAREVAEKAEKAAEAVKDIFR